MGKKHLNISILVFVALLSCSLLDGQADISYQEMGEFEESRTGMFYLVPEIGLWFGSYTNIEAAPQLGYHLTDRLSVGVGPHYSYYQNNNPYSQFNFSTHIWGIKSFSRFSVIRDAPEILPFYLFDELFVHFEYERTSLENQYFNAPNFPADGRFWTDYFYIGAGISQRAQGYTSYTVLLLWNLNDSFNSLYNNPNYRVGLSIYF
jgi:hypothetical protein